MNDKDCQCEALRKEVERLREGFKALQEGKVDVLVSDDQEISFIVPKRQIEQQNRELELLFEHMMNGFAYHQVVTDQNGLPIDYIFLRVNPAFAKMIGLSQQEIMGKKATELLPKTQKIKEDWIKTFGNVALSGEPIQFEQHFFDPFNECYLLSVYSPQTNHFAVVIKEITERKESEQALRESERSLAKAQQIAHLGNWDLDITTNTLKWSDEIYRIFGLAKDEFEATYETFLNCVHPEDRTMVHEAVRMAIDDDQPYFIDHRILLPDGTVRIVHEQGEVLRQNDTPLHMSGTIQDVTEQKEAEYELRKFSLAVEQSPASVVITDLHGDIEYVNLKFVEVTGYSPAEAIGQNQRILKTEGAPADVYKNIWETITSDQEWHGELENKKKNGETFWENVSISPIKNAEGRITHYIALKEDITERKHAEKALGAWRIRFEKTIDALSTEVCLLDKNGEIQYVNKAWQLFARQNGQENCFRGDKSDNYLYVCERAAKNNVPEAQTMLSGVRNILSGLKNDFSMQYTNQTPDKQTRHWFVATVTFFKSGEEKYLVVAHEDVTNSVLREKAESDRLNAEKANQTKSEFLANMSHEIRTPLNGVIGFTQTALRFAEREKLTIQKAVEYFEKIQNSGEHLTQLINDILDLSKIEAGIINLNVSNINLEGVVNNIWSNFEQKATEKQLTIGTKIPDNLPLVKADKQKLSQILINLLGNAVKFTEQGQVYVTAIIQDPDIIVSVRDTGIGIPREKLDEVFDKFSQIEGKPEEKNQGTGLGLAITRKLVRALGGDIWAVSEVGQGSTFSFNLKIAKDEDENHCFGR